MQRGAGCSWCTRIRVGSAVLLAGATLFAGSAAAAPNQVTGDLAGVDADITDSNIINISGVTLSLSKAAFLADGTQLSDLDTVPSGTVIKFLVWLDNTTDADAVDLSIADVLNVAFTYQSGTIKVDNTVNTGGTASAIFSAVDATSALTDTVDGDVASVSGNTIYAGNATVANAEVTAAAGKVWALLLSVEVE